MGSGGEGRVADDADDRLFALDLDPAPPDFSNRPLPQIGDTLAMMLARLLTKAGHNRLAAPADAPDEPCLANAFGAIATAAASLRVKGGLRLADHLWTHPHDLRRDSVAKRLVDDLNGGIDDPQGFLLVYATDLSAALAYAPASSPLRVARGIEVAPGVGGPYLILAACRLRRDLTAEAVEAYAQPILDARRFIPVGSELERDVWRALIHLQASLDAWGADCLLERSVSTGRDIGVTISRAGDVFRRMRVTVVARDHLVSPRASSGDEFVVTPAAWRDGSFTAWLCNRIRFG